MKVVVMATSSDAGQERTLNAGRFTGMAPGSLEEDIKATLAGSPQEDVLLVFVDGGEDKLQEIALYIKERLETQKGDEGGDIADLCTVPSPAGAFKN